MFILLLFQVAVPGCGWKSDILETVLRPPSSANTHHVLAERMELRDEWRLGIHFNSPETVSVPWLWAGAGAAQS